jgi:L-threonylcarbamoyladenylate synthase
MKMETKIYALHKVTESVLEECSSALSAGAVIVVPTETVYGLACEAANTKAREKICSLKKRNADIPMQLLLKDTDEARKISVWSDEAEALAGKFWPGEMTMVLPSNETGRLISDGFDTVGMRVPDHKFMSKILNIRGSLAATSANRHNYPPLKTEEEVVKTFLGKVDYIFLAGNIEGEASSVVQVYPLKVLRHGKYKLADFRKAIKEYQ